MDIQTIGIIVASVVVMAVLVYIYDRRSKQEPIDVMDVTKLAIGAGSIAGGVTYAVTGDTDMAETITKVAEVGQEMFTGKPEF